MALELRKAIREKLKARIGICGASGSGKTYSSLRIAYGLCGDWSKIAVIDTENRRSEHYVNTNQHGIEIGEFNVVALEPPFIPKRYIEAINLCEAAGMEVIIIDSLSHAWGGTGGMLEIKDKLGSGFDAWRKLSPIHNELIDKILRCKTHLVTAVRAKTEYLVENVNGKNVPRKIGTKPEFRDGLEFEMTLFLDVSPEHTCSASKDDSGIFGLIPFTATEESGKNFLAWLNTGKEPESKPVQPVEKAKEQPAAPAAAATKAAAPKPPEAAESKSAPTPEEAAAAKRAKAIASIDKCIDAREALDRDFGRPVRQWASIRKCFDLPDSTTPARAMDEFYKDAPVEDLVKYGKHLYTKVKEMEAAGGTAN
jgi:hypothetical protein